MTTELRCVHRNCTMPARKAAVLLIPHPTRTDVLPATLLLPTRVYCPLCSRVATVYDVLTDETWEYVQRMQRELGLVELRRDLAQLVYMDLTDDLVESVNRLFER